MDPFEIIALVLLVAVAGVVIGFAALLGWLGDRIGRR
jgi:MFS family permease